MRGMWEFQERYGTEAGCIEALAQLRWPQGYVCARCGERRSYQLKTRPRTFECACCGHQESVTAGTIFQRTRTWLRKWFLAAWWMARDKRGVSALLLSRELGLRYETAWLMAHKLRHALTERPEFPLEGLIEVDESYYGGRGKPESRGRGLANPNKSLLVMAVEKRPVGPGKGIKASGFVAGHARRAILPAANARELGGFVRAAVRPGSRLVSDDFKVTSDFRATTDTTPSSKAKARTPSGSHRSSMSCFPTSRLGSTAPTTGSAPSTCRATPGNGTTASTGARASPTWPTSYSSAPWPNRRSPIAS